MFAPAIMLASCTTYVEPVADARSITLEEGVASISRSIYQLDKERAGKPKIGIYLDNVVVTFNVNAKRTANGTAALTLASVPVLSGGALGPSASQTLGAEGYRGNQVVMTFKSTAYLGKDQKTTNGNGGSNGSSNPGSAAGVIRTWGGTLNPATLDAIRNACKGDAKCNHLF